MCYIYNCVVVLWCFQFRCWQCWQQSGVKRTESLVFASAQLDCLTLPPVGRKTYCKSGFRTHRCLFAYLHLFVTFPLSMTSIRSAYITVLMRCAMVSMVQSWKASLIVFCIRASVSESIDAVASSKRMICWKTKRDH